MTRGAGAAWLVLLLALPGCALEPGTVVPSESLGSTTAVGYPDSVTVNGAELALKCEGSGSPTIVMELGTDASLSSVSALQERLAETTLTCTYERATAATPRTVAELNDDLRSLVDAAGLPKPYVLVGQSVGGELVQLYARKHPDDVVGVVAMNSGPPCGPWLAALRELGNAQLLVDEAANCADNHAARDRLDLDASWAQEQAAPAPPDIPFELVLSTADGDWCPSGQPTPQPFASRDECLAAWAAHEQIARDLVSAWPQGHLSTVDGPHALWESQLDAITALVLDVVGRARP